MKSKRRLSGPGDRAIDRFLRAIVALDGGVVLEENDSLRINFKGGRPADRVKREPSSPEEWKTRFERLEKQAAIVLCNPPVLYSMMWPTRNATRSAKAMLRLSIGMSLSLGAPLSRRYVVMLVRGARQATIEEGSLLPPTAGAQTTLLSVLPSWAEQSMMTLSGAVLEACGKYQLLPEVQNAVRGITERRRTELAGLEHLYARRQGSDGRRYGLAEAGIEGSASIEAEQSRLQRIVLSRYAVQVRVRVLSLGLLLGSIPKGVAAKPHLQLRKA